MDSNCTETNATFPVYLLDKEPFAVTIFRIGLQVVVGVLGIIGNIIVCLVIIRKPKVLGPTSPYLFSLAIADLCTLIFNLPIAILKEQDPFRWSLGRTFCLYVAPTTETFFGAAIFSITLIAFERYVNIARKVSRRGQKMSLNQRRFILAGVWTASFAVGSIPLYMFQEYNSCHHVCYLALSMKEYLLYIITLTALWYVLPLAVIAFSYISIARLVSKRTTTLQVVTTGPTSMESHTGNLHSSSIKTMLRQKRKTYRILTPLVILFAVSMFPLTLFRLVVTLWTELLIQSYYTVLLTLVVISTIINSAADPLIYCVVNKDFRQLVKSLLGGSFSSPRFTRLSRSKSQSSRGKGSYSVSAEKRTSQTTRM